MSAALEEEPAGPRVAMTIEDATQGLTGFELIGIEKHYGAQFGELGGSRVVMGLIWAYENRGGLPGAKVKWDVIEAMTMREMSRYFAQPDPDPDSPQQVFSDSASGKRPASRTSASPRGGGRRTTTR